MTDAAGLVKANLQLDSTSIFGGCNYNGVKGRAKCNVFEDMGMAFHASQDFYSHTNWIDAPRASPSIANPQGLNNTVPATWLSPTVATFPTGLISGCYDGFPESLYLRRPDQARDAQQGHHRPRARGRGLCPRHERRHPGHPRQVGLFRKPPARRLRHGPGQQDDLRAEAG